MAEFGSHHSSEADGRPSLFEVLAEENLASGLRSAFRHLFKVLGENIPHRMGFWFRYFEEVYTVTDLVFQYVHMRTYGATFAEHFYGLKRIPDPRQLSVSEKRLLCSLVMSIVIPYLQIKFEQLFKELKEKDVNGILHWGEGVLGKTALVYLKSYPSIHFIWEIIRLCYYMTYAVHKIPYHSPLLHVCGMQLVTSIDEDSPSSLWEEVIQNNYRLSVVWTVLKTCVNNTSIGISIGAFFLQFLEWWYDREGVKSSFSPLPVPPPPTQKSTCATSRVCPLCQKPRENATALACSGFVFCYPCIFQFVKKNRTCPVTGYPAELQHLVRIYHMSQ